MCGRLLSANFESELNNCPSFSILYQLRVAESFHGIFLGLKFIQSYIPQRRKQGIALFLHGFAKRLVEKTCVILSVNKEAELKLAFCQHRHVQQF